MVFVIFLLTSPIFKGLAVIKFRNPQLWGKLQDVIQPPIQLPVGGNIDGIVPQELSHLKLNRSLLMHLESVYQYQNDKSLKGNIDIQKSFGDDVSDSDVLRWFWPNYKLLAIILSLKKDPGDILRLFQCFQMFLISFSCFHCKQSNFLTDVMIIKFVKSELVTIRERPPKSTAKFVPLGSTFHESFQLNRMCTLHFDTVRQVLELQSKIEQSSLVCVAFGKICLVLESLVHVLLAHRDSSKASHSTASTANSAFRNRYLNRSRNMSHKYTNELFAALKKGVGSNQEKTHSLRLIVMELLTLIDKVHWPHHHPKPTEAQTDRLNVQSTILVTGDLDLIAKFRLCHWPDWSVHLEHK